MSAIAEKISLISELKVGSIDSGGLLALVGFGSLLLGSTGVYFFRLTQQGEKHYSGSRSEERREVPLRVLWKTFQWLHCPAAVVSFLYPFATEPQPVLDTLPSLFSWYGGSIAKLLPIHPHSQGEAFELGRLFERLTAATAAQAGKGTIDGILAEVAKLAGRTSVSVEEVMQLPATIAALGEDRGPVHRILAVFSVINLIWLVSILGVSVTLFPVVAICAKPLANLLRKLWSRVIVPFLKMMKTPAMYLWYLLSVAVIVESARYPRDDPYSMTGTMVGCTGIAGLALSWAYQTILLSDRTGNFDLYMSMSSALFSICTAPLAYLHQSTLLGYLTVASAFTFLFHANFPPSMSWRDEERRASQRLVRGSLFLVLLNAAVKALHLSNDWVAPFQPAMALMGSAVYLNTLLWSTLEFSWSEGFRFSRNAILGANLMGYYAIGHWLGIGSMCTVAQVYSGWYAFIEYCWYCPKSGNRGIVSFFCGSAFLYALSLQLSRHPEYLSALFQL